MRRVATILVATAMPILGAACAEEPFASAEGLRNLEGLAFVPPGVCRVPGASVACITEEPLLVDRHEVTRRQWKSWAELRGLVLVGATTPDEPGRSSSGRWPACQMTLPEAREFAAERGMRLPSACEWMRIAAGTRVQSWPWEPVPFASVANLLELDLGRPLPVGTFERGATPLGTYDMLGNVWEWVEDRIPYQDDPEGETRAWAMGGSYLSRQRPLFFRDESGVLRFHRLLLDPRHRAIDVGLRCVADAEAYLWTRAASWGSGEEVDARLRAVGRRWGGSAAALLEDLCAREGAPAGLRALLEGTRS